MATRGLKFFLAGSAIKTIGLGDLDKCMDWLIDSSVSGDITVGQAYESVPYVYRCTSLRAQALSSLPFIIEHNGVVVDDWDGETMLRQALYLAEAGLCLTGEAYFYKRINAASILQGLQWFAKSTITIEPNRETGGLLGFTRRVSMVNKSYKPDQLLYFWRVNPLGELGPGPCEAKLALIEAGVQKNTFEWASAFFRRGAIPAVILQVEGNPPAEELLRLESWWKGLLQGVKRAWEAVAVRASVKPVVVGAPVKDLAMPELDKITRQHICTAFGVRPTMVEMSANYATAKVDRISFYEDTMIPEAERMAETINTQLLGPMDLTLKFTPERMDIMQEDEKEKASALAQVVTAGVDIVTALEIFGYDLTPEQWARVKGDQEHKQQQAEAAQEAQREQASERLQALNPPRDEQPQEDNPQMQRQPAKYNESHDELGRFAEGEGGGGGIEKPNYPIVSKDFEHFRGESGRLLGEGIAEMSGLGAEVYVMRDAMGKIQAAVDIERDKYPGKILVGELVSNIRGGGTAMMATVSREASKQGKGLFLYALPEARGFYAKLGMVGDPKTFIYSFTAAEAATFAARYERANKAAFISPTYDKQWLTDIIESEPSTGCFSSRAVEPSSVSKSLLADLRLWRDKTKKHAKPVHFESDAIPAGIHATVKALGMDGFECLKQMDEAAFRAEEEKLRREIVRVLRAQWELTATTIAAGAPWDAIAFAKAVQDAVDDVLVKIVLNQALREAVSIGIDFDPAVINTAAWQFARAYSYELVKGLTETTRGVVSDAIAKFVATPGMTNADLRSLLEPAFGEMRAALIGTTEVTRSFAEGTNIYRDLLKEMGMDMERVWHTSGDEKVCEICAPFNSQPENERGVWVSAVTGEEYDGPPAHPGDRCWMTLRMRRKKEA